MNEFHKKMVKKLFLAVEEFPQDQEQQLNYTKKQLTDKKI